QAGGLIGSDRRAPDLSEEKTAQSERLIAEKERRQPQARAAREQTIVRVLFEDSRRDARRLPIRGAGGDEAMQRFDIPLFRELKREPIEQVGMTGRVALAAEVFRRLDEAGAEEGLPIAIDGDASGQRIRLIDEPFREAEAVIGSVFWQGRKRLGDAGRHLVAVLVVD